MFDPKTVKRLRRQLGKKRGIKTRMKIVFELTTPKKDYFDPAKDEVLQLDLLDNLQQQLMEFHDVPGFQLKVFEVNHEAKI